MFEEKIATLEEKKREIEERIEYYKNYKPPVDEKEAYKNTVESMFDGIKLIADPENPMPLVLPMYVQANMYYKTTENDGIKDIEKVYVCVKSGMIDAIDSEYLEENV